VQASRQQRIEISGPRSITAELGDLAAVVRRFLRQQSEGASALSAMKA
jgi:hypothetical protein